MSASIVPYLRRAKVIIGPIEEWRGGGSDKLSIQLEGDGSQEGFRLKFDVYKHTMTTATPTVIQAYNLSMGLRKSLQKGGMQVALYAGWDNVGMALIFTGSLLAVVNKRSGADIVTEMLSLSALGGMSRTIINSTFASGATIKSIVLSLARKIPGIIVDEKNIVIDGNKRAGSQGLSFPGPVNTCLDNLARVHGFSWHIDNKIFYAVQDNRTLSSGVPLINADSGLIRAEPNLATFNQSQTGLTITTMFNPNINVDQNIQLQSLMNPSLDGQYKVTELVHSGDTHGQQWESRIEIMFLGEE